MFKSFKTLHAELSTELLGRRKFIPVSIYQWTWGTSGLGPVEPIESTVSSVTVSDTSDTVLLTLPFFKKKYIPCKDGPAKVLI